MHSLLKEVSYGFRTLRKTAGVTTVATITIALGIAACSTIFSVVNGVLLRPLPYAEPERLALVWSELRARNVPDFPFPIPDVRDFKNETTAFEDVAGITGGGRMPFATDTDNPEQVRSVGATPNLFKVLGVRPIYGRDFTADDGVLPPPPPQPAPGGAGRPAARRSKDRHRYPRSPSSVTTSGSVGSPATRRSSAERSASASTDARRSSACCRVASRCSCRRARGSTRTWTSGPRCA
jgi:hypothetical protein